MTAFPNSHRDLLEAAGVATLATVGSDGQPQVTAVWYLLDGDELTLSLNEMRQKSKNLMVNRKATLFFVDPSNPYRTLEVRAIADWAYDHDRVLAGKVGDRYGADLAKMDRPGERRLAVTLRPLKINTNG